MATIDSTVESALREAGEALTLRQESGGTYNVATASMDGASVTATATFAVVTGFSAFEVNGVSIEMGDIKAEMPAASLTAAGKTPAVGDHVERGSDLYRVIDLETRRFGADAVSYRLHLRGVQ